MRHERIRFTNKGKIVIGIGVVAATVGAGVGINLTANAVNEHFDRARDKTIVAEIDSSVEIGQGGTDVVCGALRELASAEHIDFNNFNCVEVGQSVHADIQEFKSQDHIDVGDQIQVQILEDGNSKQSLEAHYIPEE